MEIKDWNCKVSQYTMWQHNTKGYDSGVLYTKHGIMELYMQGDDNHVHISRIDFIHNGRHHVRSFRNKRYTRIGMVRKAKQFMREVVARYEED